MKFQAGDVVRLTVSGILAAEAGVTAIVQDPPYAPGKYNSNAIYLQIVWIKNELWNNQSDGAYSDNVFELVEEAPKPKEPISLGEIWGKERWGL